MCSSLCSTVLPGGTWSKWTSWSECSKTCFSDVDDVGIRRRFRSCSDALSAFNHTQPVCDGDDEEQEPCNTVHCPGDPKNTVNLHICMPFPITGTVHFQNVLGQLKIIYLVDLSSALIIHMWASFSIKLDYLGKEIKSPVQDQT